MKTDNFKAKKWGVFNHYLGYMQNTLGTPNNNRFKVTSFSDMVDEFDTERLADTLKSVGAGYYFITVMQGSAEMIAPNSAFDKIAGTLPGEACAKRDLVLDLYESLSKRGIDLYLYFTGDGPYKTEEIGKKFGFTEPREDGVTKEFVIKWASVLEEYAVRYSNKVKGWWIDGCYKEFLKYTDELTKIYKDAILKGNPDAVVTFNNGVKAELKKQFAYEDFTAGELVLLTDCYPKTGDCDGSLTHILASIAKLREPGKNTAWGNNGTNITAEEVKKYVKYINGLGGVVTIDCGINRKGEIFPEQIEILKRINN